MQNVFPRETFVEAGKKLLGPPYEPRYKSLFRDADLEHGQAVVRDGFRVVVVTALDPYKYKESLEDCIPLGYMSPVYVESN